MRKYIDAGRLKKDLLTVSECHPKENEIAKDFCRILDSAPAEDVEKVIHAKWEIVEAGENQYFRCTHCGRTVHRVFNCDLKDEFPYCHCGAKMDLE